MRLRGVIASALVAALAGCQSVRSADPGAADPQRVAFRGGSLRKPDADGWKLEIKGRYGLMLARVGTDADQTHVIRASMFRIRALDSDAALVAFVKEGQLADQQRVHYELKGYTVAADPGRGARCVRTRTTTFERAGEIVPGRHAQYTVDDVALICVHPQDPAKGIMVGYSVRYRRGEVDPEFEARAARVLDSVRFAAID